MGYIGESRSVNSEEAIENFEIPISMISKRMLIKFKRFESIDNNTNFPEKIFNLPIYVWKYIARKIGPSSWHHTGKYYRKTYHYDLDLIAQYICHNYKDIKNKYIHHLKTSSKKSTDNKLVWLSVIKVQEWGGSRNYRRIVDINTIFGYLHKNWLIAYNGSQHRYNIQAHRVISKKLFSNLNAFKVYLGHDIDLRKFKAFLRKHHKIVHRYSKNKYENTHPYNILYNLSNMDNNDINNHYEHGLYSLNEFFYPDKNGEFITIKRLHKLLNDLNIMIHDENGWHLSSKYSCHDNYEIKDMTGNYLYTPMFFNYLDKVIRNYTNKVA